MWSYKLRSSPKFEVRGFVQECTQKLENRAVEEIAEHDTGDDDMDDLPYMQASIAATL